MGPVIYQLKQTDKYLLHQLQQLLLGQPAMANEVGCANM
jgi:hypothetical protein